MLVANKLLPKNMIKGKSAEEIRARLNIQNDFTSGRSKNKLGKKINAARTY